MDKDSFTAKDWLEGWHAREEWQASEEARAKLEELSSQMMEVAVANGISMVICFVHGIDGDSSQCIITSNFKPLSRTPPEMLAGFSIFAEGLEEGLSTALSLASQPL